MELYGVTKGFLKNMIYKGTLDCVKSHNPQSGDPLYFKESDFLILLDRANNKKYR